MESNHLRKVEELQDIYENKIKNENDNYLQLEQQKNEMIKYYERKIEDLR